MHSLLARFCHEYAGTLRPLSAPLTRAAEAIGETVPSAAGAKMRARLEEVRDSFVTLADKVVGQQTYVAIFGPLKSGKSTLMNAIAGEYVSEVGSLPAYPCMVFVSHAPRAEFVLTDYDGRSETLRDVAELDQRMRGAHRDLADRIATAEAEGRPFDPERDGRGTIRRIDVRIPAGELARTRAMLVDTPGLYTRMRFGYDRMTRDFRDAAACAVFVVRSDTLFLEQVFADFHRLLAQFSRIFLLVNLDATKQDLGPDGDLRPSLEQRDPERIVEAFEGLAMSATLKRALADGRLQIHAVDLLRAASTRIKRRRGRLATDAANDRRFEAFFGELREYLGSTASVVAFLGDSLRRAQRLIGAASSVCDRPEVAAVGRRIAQLEAARETCAARNEALRRIDRHEWRRAFRTLREALAPQVDQLADDAEARVRRAASNAIDNWFRRDSSFNELVKGELMPLLVTYQEELTRAVSSELSERVVRGAAGLSVPEPVAAALDAVQIDLDGIGRTAHARTDRAALVVVPPTPLRPEMIDVRRTVGDAARLRRGVAVRDSLFGPRHAPTRVVDAATKQRRLGESARMALRQQMADYLDEFAGQTRLRLRDEFMRAYRGVVLGELIEAARMREVELEARAVALREETRRLMGVHLPLRELRLRLDAAARALTALAEHYARVDVALLDRAVAPAQDTPIIRA